MPPIVANSSEKVLEEYADGHAAKVWHVNHGADRTDYYTSSLLRLLKEHDCTNVLGVACGTGVDSVFLLENGFTVTSVDGAPQMLKYAHETRWERRKDSRFDDWVIKEGNWLHLSDANLPGNFDAVICMGNSIAHLPDSDGNMTDQKTAISNFMKLLKPGGVLIIDHRNYDHIVSGGSPPIKNVYYKGYECDVNVDTTVTMVNGRYTRVKLDYQLSENGKKQCNFSLSYFPLLVNNFSDCIKGVFGNESAYQLLGDFTPVALQSEATDGSKNNDNPSYYQHVAKKGVSKLFGA